MSREPRTAAWEWALRAGRGELPGLDWVDAALRPHGEPFQLRRDGDRVWFRHLPIAADLPAPLVDAAADAQQAGEPTALEAVQCVLAEAQWLTTTRGLLWTPFSPRPALLAALVEAYGVDAELHGGDPEVLTRMLVHLPRWHARRGDPEAALDLLGAAADRHPPVRLDPSGDVCFTCQSAAWWAERGGAPPPLVLRGGLAQVPPAEDDVLLGWVPRDRFPHELLRLLPAWASPRIALESE